MIGHIFRFCPKFFVSLKKNKYIYIILYNMLIDWAD